MSKDLKKKRLRRLAAWIAAAVVAIPLVVMPVGTAAVYEVIFSRRYETVEWMQFETADYPGLEVERSDFFSGKNRLAGYKYGFSGQDGQKGVVIVAHGLGGGGQNNYMPFIAEFAREGYAVFAYDATGNDESDGRVGGLPRGICDLDSAIHHVYGQPEYEGLPLILFGHSWGAYSCANVLKLHPEVCAAVVVAGFNESEDMLGHYARAYAGPLAAVGMPYLRLYERLKFGAEFTDLSAVEGIAASEASVLVVHSRDDDTVPFEYGYGRLEKALAGEERVEFYAYEDRGHSYLFYSDAAKEYRDRLNRDYTAFVEANGGEYTAELKAEFMEKNLDKTRCFAPDPELMARIFEVIESGEARRERSE